MQQPGALDGLSHSRCSKSDLQLGADVVTGIASAPHSVGRALVRTWLTRKKVEYMQANSAQCFPWGGVSAGRSRIVSTTHARNPHRCARAFVWSASNGCLVQSDWM